MRIMKNVEGNVSVKMSRLVVSSCCGTVSLVREPYGTILTPRPRIDPSEGIGLSDNKMISSGLGFGETGGEI